MRTLHFIILSALIAFSTSLRANPSINIYLDAVDGSGQEEKGVTAHQGSAPITATFHFDVDEQAEWQMQYEWRFCHEGGTLDEPYMIRYEPSPEVVFTQAGTDSIALYATFTNGNQKLEFKREYWTHDDHPLTISSSESELLFPNAFSPNGDGINDFFKPKQYQSIVDFRAMIFNRWGQKLYEWDNVAADGWDGTFHGSPVKQGVYFVLVQARGADGRVFEIKKDVNLLRTYDELSREGSSMAP